MYHNVSYTTTFIVFISGKIQKQVNEKYNKKNVLKCTYI